MSFKIGLSSNPGKDKGKAEAAMKGDQNFKDAIKEVLSEIGHCFENAQLIDMRIKENAGKAAFEEEKRKAMEGNADIKALARALGFEVEDDDDDDDDEPKASADDSSDSDDDDDGGDFSFDDDDDDDDDSDDDDDDGGDDDFNFDDDDDDDDKEKGGDDDDFDFNFDEDDD